MSKGTAVRYAGWTAVVVLALWSQARWNTLRAEPGVAREGSFSARLLGPVSSLAASVQLVRADLALRTDRPGLGYARVQSAIALDPGAPEVWSYLGYHLVFERGSSLREPDPGRRLHWIQEGLQVLERGEAHCRQPERLAFERGLMLSAMAIFAEREGEQGLRWPGGPRAAWEASIAAFERAAQAGHPTAAAFAAQARGRRD